MLRNLKSQQRSRLLNKFTENDCEKVDRLMEMHFKYLEAVQQADKRIEGEKHVGTSPFPPILSLTVLLSVCCIRNLVGWMNPHDKLQLMHHCGRGT
ncbi:hypothetical protein CgunFtcFv8_000249 [Champsocephalus gunnari]|uniref:Beta-catenin-like protein 1 N-terminal domain-containing protein n=1 Tax=Champsocephalus gunnari TaxID=52237 RepID=A0AAN8DNH6_CHAGU|nr:hypothetical protein CgunFtcFv8_000249 [Champsocephalus gunnari]